MRLTTITLIILFIVVTALSCFAQKTKFKEYFENADSVAMIRLVGNFTTGWTGTATVNIRNLGYKIDTIKSRLLVTTDNPHIPPIAYYMIGYEVLKTNGYYFECFYLDDNKNRLNKRLTVWMSKPIEP